jgi:hypothetical protein
MSVDQMIIDAPYELSTMKSLEGHVAAQKAGSAPYHYKANKSLLKSYQCNGGDTINASIVADVLVLGLMQLPNTDFFEFSYLIPTILLPQTKGDKSNEVLAGVNTVKVVVDGAKLLEQAQFINFWEYMNSTAEIQATFGNVKEFENSIRSYILTNTIKSYKNINKVQLLSLLGYKSSDESTMATFLAGSNTLDATQGNVNVIAFKQNNGEISSKKSELNVNIGDMLKLVESIRRNA